MDWAKQIKKILTGKIVCISLFVFFNAYTYFYPQIFQNIYDIYDNHLFLKRIVSQIFFLLAILIHNGQRTEFESAFLKQTNSIEDPNSANETQKMLPPYFSFYWEGSLWACAILYSVLYSFVDSKVSVMWVLAEVFLLQTVVASFCSKRQIGNEDTAVMRLHNRLVEIFAKPYWIPLFLIGYAAYLWLHQDSLSINPYYPIKADRVWLIFFAVFAFFLSQRKEARLYQKHPFYSWNVLAQILLFAVLQYAFYSLRVAVSPFITFTAVFLLSGICVDVLIKVKQLE